MMREQIHRNTPPKWLVALLLLALLSTDRACARDVRQTGLPVLEIRGVRFEFVRIPGGEFVMGSDRDELGKPAHKVRIAYEFQMGRTEVTVAQFRAFVEATGYVTDGEEKGTGSIRQGEGDWQSQIGVDWRNTTFPQSDNDPATFISWNDAMAFCRWLSAESGQEIRLPSEAEWEYACRAGTTGDYAGELNAMGWHRHNSGRRTHPVAQKQPNAWGLYDMYGNVWEWCLDAFALNYEGAPADGSPRREADRDYGVVSRGGSFINPPGWLASAGRMASFRGCSHYNNGFRLVRVVKQDDQTRPPATALVPVEVKYPTPMFIIGPEDIRVPRTKPVQKEAGAPFLTPAGTTNVALGKPVWASDEEPIIGELEMITDGDKEAAAGSYVELEPFLQHVTIDLEAEHEIYGIRLWHYHKPPRVYFDVVVQISNDADFTTDVKTIFNNDMDNSAGLGLGTDMHYVDTHFGELFDAKGCRGRYIRLYSNGNTSDDLNHYIEVEVYGRPVEPSSELVPLKIDLPRARFVGYPPYCFRTPGLERPLPGARPPILVPPGSRNAALGKPVSASAGEPLRGRLSMVVDGRKEALDDGLVELAASVQHVTIDLQSMHEIDAIVVWHYHKQPRVYFDVIVQVSEDPAFRTNVQNVFNNDGDASARLGAGKDLHYIETHEGKLVETKGVRGRYVRLYSNGNTADERNHYIEVEVYGKPVMEAAELVPLRIDYPRATFISHRSRDFMDRIPNLERPQDGPPPVLMVPRGTKNVALGKPVTTSDSDLIMGRPEVITDGAKEHNDPHVELDKGLQHITIDLEGRYGIYAIALWHYHIRPRAYFDVVVQIANDPDCETDVTTVFNNDHDNSSGLGAGSDKHYIDSFRGKIIAVDGVQGRYVRLYGNGSDEAEWSSYLEVEVYGRPTSRQ